MSQHERLHDFDRTQRIHEMPDGETAYRRWLLQRQWERAYKRGADSQKLIQLMNDIKALETGEGQST